MTTELETTVTGAPPSRSSGSLGVVVETAKVYKANGRRYFTKRAACRALAKQIINQRCGCETGDADYFPGKGSGYPGMTCWYHKDQERLEKIITRMARIIMRVKTPNDKALARARAANPTEGKDSQNGN